MNPFVDGPRVAKLRAEVEEPAQQHGQATDHRKDGKTEANHDRIEVDRHDVEHLGSATFLSLTIRSAG
jgi:hypothetical protein